MKRISEALFLLAFGGSLYYFTEIIYRGYSHWTMFLLGGICFLFISLQGLWTDWTEPLWKQILWCTIFVISGEFVTGVIVNKIMKWNVWNYANQPFQFMEQICLPFAILFSGLCAVGIISSGYLLHYLYGEIRPRFHVL